MSNSNIETITLLVDIISRLYTTLLAELADKRPREKNNFMCGDDHGSTDVELASILTKKLMTKITHRYKIGIDNLSDEDIIKLDNFKAGWYVTGIYFKVNSSNSGMADITVKYADVHTNFRIFTENYNGVE